MDIALAAEDLAFRDDVRNFLDTEFDAEMQVAVVITILLLKGRYILTLLWSISER